MGMRLYAPAHETGAVPGPPPPCPSLGHRFICMRVQSIARLLQESLQEAQDALAFWERWVVAGQQRLWSGAAGGRAPPMPEPPRSPRSPSGTRSPSRTRSPERAPISSRARPPPSAPPPPEPEPPPSAPPSAPRDQKWLRVPPAPPAILFSGLAADNDEWNRFVVSGAARDLPRYHLRKK